MRLVIWTLSALVICVSTKDVKSRVPNTEHTEAEEYLINDKADNIKKRYTNGASSTHIRKYVKSNDNYSPSLYDPGFKYGAKFDYYGTSQVSLQNKDYLHPLLRNNRINPLVNNNNLYSAYPRNTYAGLYKNPYHVYNKPNIPTHRVRSFVPSISVQRPWPTSYPQQQFHYPNPTSYPSNLHYPQSPVLLQRRIGPNNLDKHYMYMQFRKDFYSVNGYDPTARDFTAAYGHAPSADFYLTDLTFAEFYHRFGDMSHHDFLNRFGQISPQQFYDKYGFAAPYFYKIY